tara:strand:- start:2072 stop:2596 length:525 start_codon:yes stop_codon:yes gene_type:complete
MEHIDISAIVLTDTLDPDRLGLVVTAVAQPQYIEEHICLRNIPYVSLAKEVEAACLITLKRHEVGSSFVAEEKLRHAQYINPSRDPDPPFFVAVATVQTNDGDGLPVEGRDLNGALPRILQTLIDQWHYEYHGRQELPKEDWNELSYLRRQLTELSSQHDPFGINMSDRGGVAH